MPPSYQSPEEQAEQELAQTEILAPAVSRMLVAVFLLLVSMILPLQIVVEWQRGEGLQILDLAQTPLSGPDLAAFEEAHEDANILAAWVQPRMQALLTGRLQTGNSSAIVGRSGWLFYEPGISHLAGPNPFTAEALARRRALGQRHPDPRPALAALAEDSAAAGVRLILLPVSDKAAIYAYQVSRRFTGPISDPAVAELIAWAAEQGIEVFNPEPYLQAYAQEKGGPAYLIQDTHWTPSAMQRVAEKLAASFADAVSDSPAREWQQHSLQWSRVGDIVDLLRLPPRQELYQPEAVTLQQVQDAHAVPWQAESPAPILLLGDSFSNIFQQEDMGWGSSAGLAAHLAAASSRAVDQIAINGGGADAVRIELARRSRPLEGVSVLVYQFSSRDLSHGSWPLIRLPSSDRPSPEQTEGAAQEVLADSLRLRARVLIQAPPASLTAPYEHARGAFLLEVLEVADSEAAGLPSVGEEILVQTPMMENRRLRPGARWREGQALDLEVLRGVPSAWQGRELLDETMVFDDRTIWWYHPAQ